MESYSLTWKRSAAKELRKLPRDGIVRILNAVEKLAENPFAPGVRKLSGAQHTYRIRVGDYRIIFSIFAAELVIEIIRVGHRKDVYDR